ncbi:MAG: amino acid ABC transporter substrate-binding protein [Rhodobacteraceae bacterium]|nr:MAG: amino acid ABC transporter substrate-binding protein [Paracoccaceae bacterium]
MKTPLFYSICVMAAFHGAGVSGQSVRDAVIARGNLVCGSHTGRVGFGAQDASGNWQGFDVGFCRALAAAVLGDPAAVVFEALGTQDRFTALRAGDVDVLARSTTWTFQRDVAEELTFLGTSYYDGQGFLIRRALGISSALELDEAVICVEADTTSALNLEDYFRANAMTYTAVHVETSRQAVERYLAGDCNAYSTDISALASGRAGFAEAGDHVILPEVISKEPLGPVVRHDDDNWADIVRWTLFALIAAEELGVTSANVEELQASSTNPEVSRLLGREGGFGELLGLDNHWAARAIASVGNYGELFAGTIGDQTPIGLSRGLNAQWTQGGLLYSPPFR